MPILWALALALALMAIYNSRKTKMNNALALLNAEKLKQLNIALYKRDEKINQRLDTLELIYFQLDIASEEEYGISDWYSEEEPAQEEHHYEEQLPDLNQIPPQEQGAGSSQL